MLHHGLHPVLHLQFVQDVRDVRLHGCFADEELLGDLGVSQAARHQPQHVELALAEPLQITGERGRGPLGPWPTSLRSI